MSLFQIETQWSKPIASGDRQIIVQSRAWKIRLPFGGMVWNCPVAVVVLAADGRDQTLPVRDVTRLAHVLIVALGIAAAILIGLAKQRATD